MFESQLQNLLIGFDRVAIGFGSDSVLNSSQNRTLIEVLRSMRPGGVGEGLERRGDVVASKGEIR